MMDDDIESFDEISMLTVKEIRAFVNGLLTVPHSQRMKKDALVRYILRNGDESCVEDLRKAAREKLVVRDGNRVDSIVGRKRKRNDNQNTRRVVRRIDDDEEETMLPSDSFLQVPSAVELNECFRSFIDATSNEALASAVCGICARKVSVEQQKISNFTIPTLPNGHRLVPRVMHPCHTLFDGKLLEPRGVKEIAGKVVVSVCLDCMTSLRKSKDVPPQYSLANNMWIGDIPWELQRLTFPEQLLVALVYPRVYVFKLFPKKYNGGRDVSTLQRGMRGNVSSYELNVDGISSMVQGKMMPRPPAVLASVIAVTFVGVGQLPRKWLYSIFRVRRQVILEALIWLKLNNGRYFGDIDIDLQCLECLPIDDVPGEILGIVRQTEEIGVVDRESDGYVPSEETDEHGEEL